MDPQIIISALSSSFISDCVRGVFQLATKNKFPCQFVSGRKCSIFPSLLVQFCPFPFSLLSGPSQLCVLPQAKRNGSDQLWPVISQRKPQHFPLSSHYSLRAHRQACKSKMKRCSNTPQKRSGNYTSCWRSLFVCMVSVLKQGYGPNEKSFIAIKPQVERDNERAEPLKSTSVKRLLCFCWKITKRYGSVLLANPVWHINRGPLKGEMDVWTENNQNVVCLFWPVYNYCLLSTWHMYTSAAIEIMYCL